MNNTNNENTEGIFILLGSNMGGRMQNLQNAISHISTRGIQIVKASGFYETAPWGNEDQPAFINQVIQVNTTLSAQDLLAAILDIEIQMGRERDGVLWGPRLIDMDLLFYHQEIIDAPGITVPHPEIPFRRFTLVPLCEVKGDFIHPQLNINLKGVLKKCKDPLTVFPVNF